MVLSVLLLQDKEYRNDGGGKITAALGIKKEEIWPILIRPFKYGS